MKTIGLIGGMSWESSVDYYRYISEAVRERLGGQNNAKLLMYTVNFDEIEQMQREGRWDDSALVLVDAAQRLERGGADLILICANTMHLVAPAIQKAVHIPLVHIASATAERICAAGISRVGLLGTRFTMEKDFYKRMLTGQYGLEVLIPGDAARAELHRIIYDELCLGVVRQESRRTVIEIMQGLVSDGAQGIILGCTEIPMLVKPEDSPVPLFDTTRIHAEKAVELALGA